MGFAVRIQDFDTQGEQMASSRREMVGGALTRLSREWWDDSARESQDYLGVRGGRATLAKEGMESKAFSSVIADQAIQRMQQ